MATTLAETRNVTLATATGMMEALAHCACRMAIVQAKKAKKIAEVESQFAAANDADKKEAELLTMKLKAFCTANPHLFEKPRKMKTPFGEFGLQSVSDLSIDNAAALIQTLMVRGYDECLKTETKIIKDNVRTRMENGEEFPGATIRRSENDPVVKVAPKLLKEAVEAA